MSDENQTVAWNDQALQWLQSAVIQPWDDFILDFWDWENSEEIAEDSTSIDMHNVTDNSSNDEVKEEAQENMQQTELSHSEPEVETSMNQEWAQEQWDFDITLWEDETWVSIQSPENWENNEEVVYEAMPVNTEDEAIDTVADNDSVQENIEENSQETQNISDDIADNVEKDMAGIDVVDIPQETADLSKEDHVEDLNITQEDVQLEEDNSMVSSIDSEQFSDLEPENENNTGLNEDMLWTNVVVEENVIGSQDWEESQIADEASVWEFENQDNGIETTDSQIKYDFSDSNQDSNGTQDIFVEEDQPIGSDILDEDTQQDKLEEYKEESSDVNLNGESFGDIDSKVEDNNKDNLNENNDEDQGFTLDLTWSDLDWETSIEPKSVENEQPISNQDIDNGFLLDDYNNMENMPELHEEVEDINTQEERNETNEQPELMQDYSETGAVNEEWDTDVKLDLWNNNDENTSEDKQSESVGMLSEENTNDNFWVNQEEVNEDAINDGTQEDGSFSYEQNNPVEEDESHQLDENTKVVTENTIVDSVAITPNEKEEDIAGSIWVSWFADKLKELSSSNATSSIEKSEHNEVQSTLSLDQILDTELLSNPQLANNSTAVPVNTPVRSGLFSNKKIVWIIAWVWIFLLLWFVAALAFPTWSKDRNPNEVVSENLQYEIEPTEEHPSAPTDLSSGDVPYTEENPKFDPYTNSWNNTNTWEDLKPTSTVYFPVADDPTEIEYEQPILEPEPYTCTDCWISGEEEQENPFELENEINVDKIKVDISSFKSQGEIYYSAGQSTSDRQLMKYASQMIYLCDNYENQINSWEWINEESYSWFKSNIMWVLSKIDHYINWWDETIVVQTLEDKSYFEGKDELKQYIYENR